MATEKQQKRKMKHAAGCVVYRYDAAGTPLLLLIYDRYGAWSLPKGHLEGDETEAAAAVREVWEETGVRGVLGPLVGRVTYQMLDKQRQPRLKQVAFFLMRADAAVATPRAEEGIRAAEWYPAEAALARLTYPQVRAIVEQALGMLG